MNSEDSQGGFVELRELSVRDGNRVCVCRRTRDGETTVVKFLPDQPDQEPVWGDPWFRQPPPGIMPIRAWGRGKDGGCWVEMPFADAMEGAGTRPDSQTYTPANLRLRMAEEASWSLDKVVTLARRLATALRALHERGWSHRDVKPSNIFFLGEEAVLGDLDLVGPPGHHPKRYGTQGYMPMLGIGDQAGDLFALGRTLYEVWTGKDRFEFPSTPVTLLHSPDWEERGMRFNDLLLRLCPSDPRRQRIRTAEDLLAALDELDRPPGGGRRRLRQAAAMAIAGCLLAAVLFGPPADKAPRDLERSASSEPARKQRNGASDDRFSVQLSVLAHYAPGERALKGVAVQDGIAYIALGEMGVHLLDVARPDQPRLLARHPMEDARGIDVQGAVACFVSGGDEGAVHLVDVSDPAKPSLIGGENLRNRQWCVSMRGDRAYVAGGKDLLVIDIASPEHPTLTGYFDFPSKLAPMGKHVAVQGANAYLADGPNGVQVFSVADPRALVRLGSFTPPGCDVEDVRCRDGLVYVAAEDPGLFIVDFSRPESPVVVGSYTNDFRPQSLTFVGPYAFVGARERGIVVLNIADPRNPRPIATLNTDDWARGICVSGNNLFTAEKERGMGIYRVDYGPGVAPMLTDQPRSQSVAAGGTVRFGVAAAGHEPMSFQWRKNGRGLPGETNASLAITPVSPAAAGPYEVEVRNGAGSVVSSNAVLSVTER